MNKGTLTVIKNSAKNIGDMTKVKGIKKARNINATLKNRSINTKKVVFNKFKKLIQRKKLKFDSRKFKFTPAGVVHPYDILLF